MNRIFYNTIIFVTALFLGVVILVSSIRPSEWVEAITTEAESVVWSKMSLSPDQTTASKVQQEKIDVTQAKVSQDTPILVDFGRLSSFLYLATAGSQADVIKKNTATGVTIGNVSGIISLYDLFLSYIIYDSENAFRIEQITNGSFYIGKEKDGKVSIYAIDGVARLIFMDDSKDMTSMILFPGSYIRFDPSRNRSLKNADLFRTILSLKDTDNEVFEFVNPRVNIGNEEDTFFNYRMPKKSMILFRILSARFKEKVDMMDLGRYKAYGTNAFGEQSTWLLNPSKKNHNLLLELSALLSKAVNSNTDPEILVPKIGRLYNQAKWLNIEQSTAKTLVEQFLLDGRFALYAGVSNSKYQYTYESIAKIIGIEPTSAKSQLLQNLANIYSKNLFTQKNTSLWLTIDTYAPTAAKLLETLDKNEIEQKDNFDIAIYAFNILKKMEERPGERPWELPDFAMEDSSTYSYFMAFFRASTRYMSSIEDIDKKQEAIMWFSRQFYDTILTMIVNSLYKSFVVSEDNALYVHSRFREWLRVTMPVELISNINSLNATIEMVSPSIESLWTPSGNNDTFIQARIHKNIIRLQALTKMISPEDYKEYVKSPYKSATGSLYPFPEIDAISDAIVRIDPKEINTIKNTKLLAIDPRIKDLKKIWPDADASSWVMDGDNIRVVNAPYRIARNDEGISPLEISALYAEKTFTDTRIKYNDYTIRVVSDSPMTIQTYYVFLTQIHVYLDVIDKQLKNATEDVSEMTIFASKERINIGQSLYSVSMDK